MKREFKMLVIGIGCIVGSIAACKNPEKEVRTGIDPVLEKPPYKDITDSIRLNSSDAALYGRRALLLTQNNLHDLANEDYKKSWQLKPDLETGLRFASNLNVNGHLREKIELLQECIKRYPENKELKRLLGEAYVDGGRSLQARIWYDSLLKQDPGDFDSWFEKGLLLEQAGDTAGALEALNKAYAMQPTQTYGIELAHLYAENRQPVALQICDELIKNDKAREFPDPFFVKGIFYSNTHQDEKALIQFDSCIKRDWKFTDAYIEKGIIFYKKKDFKAALSVFQLTTTVSNTSADAYFWIGRCNEALGDKREALENYERAISLDRNFTEAREAASRLK